MKKNLLYTLAVVFSIVFFTNYAQAQLKLPAPSPFSKVTQKVGLMEASVEYSRPSMKGRVIFGDLLPYGKMWRAGANSPTKLHFDKEVTVEGTTLSAGAYTLMAIPEKSEWTIILNKDSKGNGVFSYNKEEDVARFKVKATTLSAPVETVTINFTDITMKTAKIELAWEKTSVKFAFSTEIDENITAQIKKALDPNKDAGTYFQIANYYYQKGEKLDDALKLITKSTDMTPRFWSVHLKAKIQAKLKDKKGAITTAKKSMEMAKEAKNDDYVRLNEKLISTLQ